MEEGQTEKSYIVSGLRCSITSEQLEGLMEFMEQHPMLAKGRTRPLSLSQSLWAECANKLNGYEDGSKKNGRQWAKCWTDMKYRIRRRALEVQTAKENGEPVPVGILPFSNIEERILALIGYEDTVEVVIKCDPLNWEEYEKSAQGDNNESNDNVTEKATPRVLQRTARARKARQQTSQYSSESASPPDKKHKPNRREAIESDSEDSASAFLELEKRKLESADRLTEAVLSIRDQMARMTEAMMEIKDYFINKHNNH